MKGIENLFPTPVYWAEVDNFNKIQDDIEKNIRKAEFKTVDWGFGYTLFITTTNFKDNIVKELGFNHLIRELDKHIKLYCKELGFPMRDYTLTSWFSLYNQGQYAHVHEHQASADISACYYFKTEGDDGSFFFEPPIPYFTSTLLYNESKKGGRIEYTPKNGQLLLFPSWLKHGVTVNKTEKTRISIAFNIKFKN